ncbi:MAG: Mur ligase family protein, partial [Firmicutes bacterium]|nr:Mur ligase family protein [Bacillota bacterium]
MFRFFIALWISKFLMNFRKLANSDFPGKAACKICPKFLKLISRPKLTICVTGTNGKSVTSGLVSDFLSSSGMSVSYNERGWNLRSGFAVNLINGV